MIQIIDKDFKMVHVSGPFFDLSQMVKINAGKENEREEIEPVFGRVGNGRVRDCYVCDFRQFCNRNVQQKSRRNERDAVVRRHKNNGNVGAIPHVQFSERRRIN